MQRFTSHTGFTVSERGIIDPRYTIIIKNTSLIPIKTISIHNVMWILYRRHVEGGITPIRDRIDEGSH